MADSVVDKLAEETRDEDVPEDVSAWLGRLVLLYGVPFQYLIPEEQILPPESIRFFYVDPIWIQCAIQGACSVGNTDCGDTLIDTAMNKLVQPNEPASGKETGRVTRSAAARERKRLRQQFEDLSAAEESGDLEWPLTGFLLRSAVVKGWRGLEIMADKAKPGQGFAPLQALRIEQLSADVMLGIFNGKIARVVIRQPQEGLHFGVTRQRGSFSKALRKMGYTNPTEAGEISQVNVISGANLMRAQAQSGVIKVAEFAAQMKARLTNLRELKDEKFTSAEFAVQMIEAAGEFTFLTGMGT
jgi:hypothetical protein